MTTKLTFIVLFVLFTGCTSSSNGRALTEDISATATHLKIVTDPSYSELIQKMLDLPNWQWVYHPEATGRLPVKMLKNEIINEPLRLIKFNQKVQIISDAKVQKASGYIEIKELRFQGDTAYFAMEYLIEGAFANGHFLKKNGEWEVGQYRVTEH